MKSGRTGAREPGRLNLSCKGNKCSDAGTGDPVVLPTHETPTMKTSNYCAPGVRHAYPGRFSGTRQSEPTLRQDDNLYVAYWNAETLHDVDVQALTMREFRKCYVDIAHLSEFTQ